jgi:hypothetical protein
MSDIITVDGIGYDVRIPSGGVERRARIKDGKNKGDLKSGAIVLDTVGTYYDYTITVVRAGDNVAAYDALYEVLTDPFERMHNVTVPYGRGTITFDAYVPEQGIKDTLIKKKAGVSYWSGFSVELTAIRPFRTT